MIIYGPPCNIRVATEADIDLLIDLGIATFNETFAHLNSREDMEAYLTSAFDRAQVASEVADPRATFFIAECDGRASGYAKIMRGEAPECVTGTSAIEMARLYVLKEAYGKGIGQALMQQSIERAVLEDFKTMWLGVWEHNERAKAFYRKWGFREIGSHIFQLGSDPQTDLLMERPL